MLFSGDYLEAPNIDRCREKLGCTYFGQLQRTAYRGVRPARIDDRHDARPAVNIRFRVQSDGLLSAAEQSPGRLRPERGERDKRFQEAPGVVHAPALLRASSSTSRIRRPTITSSPGCSVKETIRRASARPASA